MLTIPRNTHAIGAVPRDPQYLDDVTAAAIANPGSASWAAYTARLKAGETVLVNGATGTAGRLAVQIAKHLGAKSPRRDLPPESGIGWLASIRILK